MTTPFFINETRLIRDNPAQLNYGAAVVDVDFDGEFEIVVTGFNAPGLVLKWTGREFVDLATDPLYRPLTNSGRQAIGVAACDMDRDGREEIYILNSDTFGGRKRVGDSLYKWQGLSWLDVFRLPENEDAVNQYSGRSIGCIDRLGTGEYGFFVANYGGPMRLFEMLRDSLEIVDAAPELGLNIVTGGRAVLPAPFVSPYTDVFLNNENGPNCMFRNNGDGTFTDLAEELGLADRYEHGRGVAAFDANNDGQLDLVYGNWEGPHRLYIQNEAHQFTDIAPPQLSQTSKVRTVIAADFDNDGYDEIFFNNIVEPNRLFFRAEERWTPLNMGEAQRSFGAGTGAVIGDFGKTGELKLLITHGETMAQPMSYYVPRPNNNNWLRVRPLTAYGAPARGTLVRLSAGGRIQTKVIDAGSGYLCQMEPIAHFGLGLLTEINYIEISWPDGKVERLHDLPINTVHTVRYGE